LIATLKEKSRNKGREEKTKRKGKEVRRKKNIKCRRKLEGKER
jgi:hypothetical protein